MEQKEIPGTAEKMDELGTAGASKEKKQGASQKDILIAVILLLLIIGSVIVVYLFWDKNGSSVTSAPGSESQSEMEEETDTEENGPNEEELEEENSDEILPHDTEEPDMTSCTFYLTEGSSPGSGEIFTRWVVEGCDTSNGYRVVRSISGTPSYPADDYRDTEDGNADFTVWTENVSGTYQVRMCLIADDGSCGEYTSNTLSVTVL